MCFGGYFVYKGIRHFMNHYRPLDGGNGRWASIPSILWGMTGVTLVVGGLCFVFGWYPFYGLVWSGSVVSHTAVATR